MGRRRRGKKAGRLKAWAAKIRKVDAWRRKRGQGGPSRQERVAAYLREKRAETSPVQHCGENPCPKCGAELVPRTSRFGQFFGCSRFPACDGKAGVRFEVDGTRRAVRPPPRPPRVSHPSVSGERLHTSDAWGDALREGEKLMAEVEARNARALSSPDEAERQRKLAESLAARAERERSIAERWAAAAAEGDAALARIFASLDGWVAVRTVEAEPPAARVAEVLDEAWVGIWRVRLLRGHGGGLCLARDRMDEAHATYFLPGADSVPAGTGWGRAWSPP